MERIPFKVLLMEQAKQKRELHRQFLSKVPLLGHKKKIKSFY